MSDLFLLLGMIYRYNVEPRIKVSTLGESRIVDYRKNSSTIS